jgi:hypothetical protein
MIEVLSIGDKLVPGEYRIHSRFSKAVNFECGDELAIVTQEEIGSGPINLVTRGVDFGAVQSLRIDENRLFIDDNEFRFDDRVRFQSELVFTEEPEPMNLFSNLQAYKDALISYSPPKSLAILIEPQWISEFRGVHEKFLFAQSKSAALCMQQGKVLACVRGMRGLGIGLTPSGDDFNAGIMAAYGTAGKIMGRDYSDLINDIYANAIGKNLLSNAFLKCARDGRFTECQKVLLTALLFESEDKINSCTRELCRIGETSGADWGVGVFFTFNRI